MGNILRWLRRDQQPATEPHHQPENQQKESSEESENEGPWNYTFSKADVERDVGPPVILNQSFLQRTREHLAAIEQEYEAVLAMREEIHNIFMGFKQSLELSEEKKLSVCFKKLRELVEKRETLELNAESKIEISPEADDGARQAVHKFNGMVDKCMALRERLVEAKANIKERISAIEGEVQTQATEDATKRARKQARYLRNWSRDITAITEDSEDCSVHLLPNRTFKMLNISQN